MEIARDDFVEARQRDHAAVVAAAENRDHRASAGIDDGEFAVRVEILGFDPQSADIDQIQVSDLPEVGDDVGAESFSVECEGVVASPTGQVVVASATGQGVVASVTAQDVSASTADDDVIKSIAGAVEGAGADEGEVFNGACVGVKVVAERGGVDGIGAPGIDDNVSAVCNTVGIGAGATFQRVTGAADTAVTQCVIAGGAAGNDVGQGMTATRSSTAWRHAARPALGGFTASSCTS